MKGMVEDIKIARAETDLEWRPVLDGVHAYADLRRLGRRLAAERHVTDETIACLTGELERAIAEVEKLTRERDEARDHRDLATGKLLMVGSEIGGDPKLDPKDHRDPRWTPTLEDAAKLRTDNERLRKALRLAEGPIAIAASYADQPCETMGMRAHAKDCARVLPEIRAALAGECGRADQ